MIKSRYGVVTFVGFTNSGKSTLFNQLLQKHLSPVTPKQTTTCDNYYYLFRNADNDLLLIDTPGFQSKRYHKITIKGNSQFYISMEQADVICIVGNVTKNIFSPNYQKFIHNVCEMPGAKPCILILNKIDLIKKEHLIETVALIGNTYPKLVAVVPISALRGINIQELINVICKTGQRREKNSMEVANFIQNSTEEQLLLFLRQAFLLFYHEEIPYSIKYNIFHDQKTEKKTTFFVKVIVKRQSTISSLIGKKGILIQKIIHHCERNCYLYDKSRIKIKLFFSAKR